MLADVPGDGETDKAALRQRVLARRATIPPADRVTAGEAVARAVLGLPETATVTTVAAYWALADEVPTASLLSALLARGARVLLPVLREDADLDWRAYDGTDGLHPGRRGTSVPRGAELELSTVEVVVAPGLAFDASGGRLGRGGGSFDRALAQLAPGTTTIGLAYDEDVLDAVPTAAHDVHVAVVVTPTRVIRV